MNQTSQIFLKRQYTGIKLNLVLILIKDLLKICSDFGFSIGLIDDDLFKWNICIFGQSDTLYEVMIKYSSN